MNHFGEDVAKDYDSDVKDRPVTPVVEFLRPLAGDGRALEFGIGTGRIAVRLSEAGVEVHGIDLSPEMLARVPASAGIDVTVGDFATAKVPGQFQLAYLVFNTITNLTTQDARASTSTTSRTRQWSPVTIDSPMALCRASSPCRSAMSGPRNWTGWPG
ncbi:class I SAM-dependent methyltransferase [Kibdelosporangium philippinense]|uniref:Class I SAM-dependent methyltransferase n=1 Tax=Kibdelosporangium philippinense TaxID=211113 RepID=A0ABS8Z7W2_9PSEU|nr:class I SAM-dependent methyltransferase [Kibdelosporangium philippinense]